MKPPRGLTADERAAWARLAGTVTPLDHPRIKAASRPKAVERVHLDPVAARLLPVRATAPTIRVEPDRGLDSHWDRKLRTGNQEPDFSLDLHGLTLEQAHARLESGLTQARSLGARLVLVVTGKQRPVEAADRGERRGAIRAKILDWLAVGRHADAVAAVRQAHRRHGGEGALYLVLRRTR